MLARVRLIMQVHALSLCGVCVCRVGGGCVCVEGYDGVMGIAGSSNLTQCGWGDGYLSRFRQAIKILRSFLASQPPPQDHLSSAGSRDLRIVTITPTTHTQTDGQTDRHMHTNTGT
uniref:Secreted protein n=1 Tax=Vitrella brassicaformis TaxID=1169539 RepID=A0A7S1P9W3_9ALVE|mmetsp:Transcript_4902/g.11427  ORF Transcript_4902/g.11427 Transcript_4902/m.11427 type:complete len:116 (+) Transcript_4902:511-858(+)